MAPPENVMKGLLDAGASSVSFNSPMSQLRAGEVAEWLAGLGVDSVVDLGCGRGQLARTTALRLPGATVVGVDNDEEQVDRARALTADAQLQDRVSFEVADASEWSGSASAAICVGASHAFGGPAAMFSRLGVVVPNGVAIVADTVWDNDPNPWCIATFGHLPADSDALAAEAVDAGWTVVGSEPSTSQEWDEFEHGWIAGVRAVGTPEAMAFARERELDYERYRSVLGFRWLYLQKSHAPDRPRRALNNRKGRRPADPRLNHIGAKPSNRCCG